MLLAHIINTLIRYICYVEYIDVRSEHLKSGVIIMLFPSDPNLFPWYVYLIFYLKT